ncbi:MAG: hypothetical protein CTY15_05190 [Methylocystis sp.]|nr:MAG: hypothetical protein CTY15_05190 [Methylocystis sp.]
MSIFPATDLVAGVARAAEPQKLSQAMKRLDATAAAPVQTRFAASLDVSPPRVAAERIHASHSRDESPTARKAAEKFEAFILQSWLESLLPKEDSGAFGSGASANVWRSMMAEQLGVQLAHAGGIGLQKALDDWNGSNT